MLPDRVSNQEPLAPESFALPTALLLLRKKMFEVANKVDQDVTAHKELPHLDLHCLPSSF